jgi:hypothetical protein
MGGGGCLLMLLVLIALPAPRAEAHDEEIAGPLRLLLGWAEEPSYSGVPNAVELTVTSTLDGTPIDDLGAAAVTVEVIFGSETAVLELAPSGEPGVLDAELVPTRPGTYRFHVAGTIAEQEVDFTSVCSEETFDCVGDVADVQFPTRDPSTGELSDRFDRELERDDGGDGDRMIAFVGLAIATLALLTALVVVRRPGR